MSSNIGSIGGFDPTTMWASLFNKVDSNSDESVSKTEFESAVSSMASSQNLTTSQADSLFSQLDTDGDGSVSKSEMMSALKAAGDQMRASMPPLPPPSTGDSQDSQSQSLTDDQKKTVDSILSKYDSSNLTASDVKAINQSFSDAGISFGKALGDEVESQGFSIQNMMSLAGPPDAAASGASATSTTASTTSGTSTNDASTTSTTAENSMLSDLVNYLSSLSSSDTTSGSDSDTQFSQLLQSLQSSGETATDQTSSMFNQLIAMLQTSSQYGSTGGISYGAASQQSLTSTYA